MFCGAKPKGPSGNTTIIDASRSLYGQSNSAIGGQLKDAIGSIFGNGGAAPAAPPGLPKLAQTGGMGMGGMGMPMGGLGMAQTGIGSLMMRPQMYSMMMNQMGGQGPMLA